MNAFNPAQFRAQFPALADAGIYLDSAATALKPQAVIDATQQFYSLSAGNVHRSQFAEAQRLTARYEAARDRVAALLNAPSGKNIVWTRGTTEAINMVAQCYARPRLKAGDEIIVSVAEHHANLVPWLMVAEQTGARIVKLPLAVNGVPDVEQLDELITPRSRILALGQMSNVTRLPGSGSRYRLGPRRRHGGGGRRRAGRGALSRRRAEAGHRLLRLLGP